MKRFLGIFAPFMVAGLMALPAQAAVYVAYHPNCQDSASDKAECVRVKINLYNSQGNSIEWKSLYAYIDADDCRITLANGSSKVIAGRTHVDVSDANWPDVGRIFFMPRACPVTVHARHPTPWYTKDNLYDFRFDNVKTENDVCWRLEWYYNRQSECSF